LALFASLSIIANNYLPLSGALYAQGVHRTIMKIHKGDIAMDMLGDAIDLFHDKRFLSSLHLASAASELLSGLCEINGLESSHQSLKQMVKDFHDSNPEVFAKPKVAIKRFNYSKNAVKHINGEQDQFAYISPEMHSEMYIKQCQKMLDNFGLCLVKRI
jgi:hypothetical protein